MADFKEIMVDGQVYQVKDETARENQGGYEPPAGGIPKTDLASDVQTSLGKADTALQQADKTQLQNAINSLQSALNTITQDGATQGVIDTFNEVKAFLEGIDTDDPTLFNQLKSLSDAITALQNTLSTKANDNAVVKSISVNGTAQTKDGNGNVNVSVPTLTLDDAPTAGSDNAVKSKGIKTALDNLLQNLTIGQNGNWYVGQTDTGVKAQGPQGNCTITDAGQMVSEIVNDLDTGGGSKFLSAEMGKALKTAISTLIDSMGEYCFPNGRPTLSFEGPKCDVTQNLTDVDSDFSALRVNEGGSLEITLTPSDNLHVFLTGDVTVTMGGTDITSTTWNESTGKVTIREVTDDVVITAKSSTYESGLAFHLDYKNPGDEAGHWIDLIHGVDFKLTEVTETDAGMSFNGSSSKAEVMDDNDPTQPAAPGSKYLDVAYDAGTIEVIAQAESGSLPDANNSGSIPLFINPREKGIFSAFRMGGKSTSYASCLLVTHACVTTADTGDNLSFLYNGSFAGRTVNGGNNIAISANTTRTVDGIVRLNGVTQSTMWFDTWIAGPSKILYTVGYYCSINDGTVSERFFNGKIKAIRVYPYKLTEQQMIKNYKVDKKRFNLA